MGLQVSKYHQVSTLFQTLNVKIIKWLCYSQAWDVERDFVRIFLCSDRASCVWILSSDLGDQLRLSWIITRLKFRSPFITYYVDLLKILTRKDTNSVSVTSLIPNILIWIEEIEEIFEKNTFICLSDIFTIILIFKSNLQSADFSKLLVWRITPPILSILLYFSFYSILYPT